MEFPQIVNQLIHKKEEKEEYFLSLFLDVGGIGACLWSIDEKHLPKVTSCITKLVNVDSWDVRIAAVEDAVSSLDVEADTVVEKVILGLPALYLTEEGDIKKDIRPHLRKLTQSMELSPLGFVSIHQALVHQLKSEEGVPPTVILLGVSDGTMTVSVYKIGALVGNKTAPVDNAVANLEEIFHGFHDLEVLPSRIIIYGTDENHLKELQKDFLHHPWQTHANFMHFPKIDIMDKNKLISAVSLVGASELATAMAADEPEEETIVQEQEAVEEQEEKKEDLTPFEETESNVTLVDPGSLGFRRSDVLRERPSIMRTPPPKETIEPEMPTRAPRLSKSLPAIPPIHLPPMPFRSFRFSSSRLPVLIGIGVLCVIILFIFYWYVPHASVTLFEVSKKISKSDAISIDPTATIADPSSKILPGKKQEKTVSGDKAIAVTGKKQVGDPAKGAIKIYNKTFDSVTVSKGTVFTAGNLAFTLDADVSIASASAVNFTTNTGGLTASAIGAASNVPANTIFSIHGYSLTELAAQNDQAFSGGTSKDITVVTRADQDALVKSLTADLVEKAKQDLSGSVTGDDILIDGTIKTTVTDKSFVEELDQEAGNLHGKITISLTGTSYNKKDLASLMTGIIGPDIPPNYLFDSQNMTVTLKNIVVKQDGKMTATADFEGTATPQIDIPSIIKSIAGKSVSSAQDSLKSVPGIGSAAIDVKVSPWKNRLPANAKNISVSVAIQQ